MTRKLRIALVCGLLVTTLVACNLPRRTPTPAFEFPTPNMTLTALFQPGGILGTATPAPQTNTPAVDQSGGGAPAAQATATFMPVATVLATSQPGSAATSASGPSASATPLRANSRFEATFLTTPPTLDGVWDEWENRGYPAKAVIYGRDKLANPEDLEGSFRVGWDNNNLYIAVKVIDDKYVQNATGVLLYQGDSLEIQMDTDLTGDLNTTSLSSDDYQLGISPGRPDTSTGREAYLWNPSSAAGARTQVQIASVGGDGVYRVEMAIPWSLFGITPEANDEYGFSLNISDNDNEGENVQESMMSAVSGRELLDPTTWGVLILRR